MGILDLFRQKQSNRHVLTQEDRDKAVEVNQARFELQRARIENEKAILQLEKEKRELQIRRDMAKLRADIAEYEGDDFEEGEEAGGVDGMFQNLLMGAILKGQSPDTVGGGFLTSPSPPTLIAQPPTVSLSDDQLRDIWEGLPKMARKAAKKLSDDQIAALIRNKVGNVDAETVSRAVSIVRAP